MAEAVQSSGLPEQTYPHKQPFKSSFLSSINTINIYATMASTAATQTLCIHREHLTPDGDNPGQLLTDNQIRGLAIFRATIANEALVSFTAEGPDYLWRDEAAIYQANIQRFQAVVRAHIATRLAADAARSAANAAQAAALVSGQVNTGHVQPQVTVRSINTIAVEAS